VVVLEVEGDIALRLVEEVEWVTKKKEKKRIRRRKTERNREQKENKSRGRTNPESKCGLVQQTIPIDEGFWRKTEESD
jgi:hypothetical protein